MSTLSRMEESLPRTSDISPPSGVEDDPDSKNPQMDDEDLIVRLDGYGGNWGHRSDGWRLGVDFGARADHKDGPDGGEHNLLNPSLWHLAA